MYELKSEVEAAFDITIPVSGDMQNAMEIWMDMYQGKPIWKPRKDKEGYDGCTLQLPAAVASELARLVTLEMKVSVGGSSPWAKCLDKQIQSTVWQARNFTEIACALGGVVLKPYIIGDTIGTAVVTPDSFLPVEFDNDGDITSAVFPHVRQVGEYRYTRLEYHKLAATDKPGIYDCTIENKRFKQKVVEIGGAQNETLGTECSLSEVPDWSGLTQTTVVRDVKHCLFAYFKMPFTNTVELRSPLGVSAYAKAIDVIRSADLQFNRILWEYEAKETAIYASQDIFPTDDEGKVLPLPKGRDRLYRKTGIEAHPDDTVASLIEPYSPEIRYEPMFNALNNYKREVEFACGLAYGTLSEMDSTEKTATEIMASKQRSGSTVADIQKRLEKALNDLVLAMSSYAHLYLTPDAEQEPEETENAEPKPEPEDELVVSCDWDDSIVSDRSQQYTELYSLVSAGIIKPEVFISWYFGCSEEDAVKYMPPEDDYEEEEALEPEE